MDSAVLFLCIIFLSQSYCTLQASANKPGNHIDKGKERDSEKAYIPNQLLHRVKRQDRKTETAEIDWSRVDRSLYGWRPTTGHPGCPQGHFLCRDKSYCFERRSLCNNLVSCDDQSDEINENCGYTTTKPQPTTTSTTTTTTTKDGNSNPGGSTGSRDEDETRARFQRDRFNDPLVIAFLVFVIAMLIYVIAATAWCIKYRMNSVRPRLQTEMDGSNAQSLRTVKSQQISTNKSESPGLQQKVASDGNGTPHLTKNGDIETKLSE